MGEKWPANPWIKVYAVDSDRVDYHAGFQYSDSGLPQAMFASPHIL